MGQANYRKSQASQKRQREGQLLLGFRRTFEEGCFEQKVTGKQEFEVVVISHGLQAMVSALLLGQGETFFLLKAGDKNSYMKSVLACQDMNYFPDGLAGCS